MNRLYAEGTLCLFSGAVNEQTHTDLDAVTPLKSSSIKALFIDFFFYYNYILV